IAWIGASNGDAAARLPTTGGWARPDGLPFTSSANALNTVAEAWYPPRLDDDGADVTEARLATPVMTQLVPSDKCLSDGSGALGRGGGDAPPLLDDGAGECLISNFLYCFETDRTPSTVLAPQLGADQLYAFVTNNAYAVVDGIDALDNDCQMAADAAQIKRTF